MPQCYVIWWLIIFRFSGNKSYILLVPCIQQSQCRTLASLKRYVYRISCGFRDNMLMYIFISGSVTCIVMNIPVESQILCRRIFQCIFHTICVQLSEISPYFFSHFFHFFDIYSDFLIATHCTMLSCLLQDHFSFQWSFLNLAMCEHWKSVRTNHSLLFIFVLNKEFL